MRVFIVNGSHDYEQLFKSFGHILVDEYGQPELIVFTGGADVDPYLYGDKAHSYTHSNPQRDHEEALVFSNAMDNKIPMVGICRGAQFLNVMSGGRMYQHVEKHTRSHAITDLQSGDTIHVSSTHHQMMLPSPKALLVASSTLGGEREWFDGQVAKKDVSKEDIEVVYYEDTNCLCFQPHPEFNSPEFVGMKVYFRKLLEQYLGVK